MPDTKQILGKVGIFHKLTTGAEPSLLQINTRKRRWLSREEVNMSASCDGSCSFISVILSFPLSLLAPSQVPTTCGYEDKGILTLCRRPRILAFMRLLYFLHLATLLRIFAA